MDLNRGERNLVACDFVALCHGEGYPRGRSYWRCYFQDEECDLGFNDLQIEIQGSTSRIQGSNF
jgi:hypothetical protein